MGADDIEDVWYPTVEDIITMHDDILNEYPETEPGIRNRGDIAYAIEFISEGRFGERPETLHEKAFHILRLLTANHPFVDGNKRTALNTTATFYLFNGYEFQFDDRVRKILRQFASDASSVEEDDVIECLRETTTPIDVDDILGQWREELIQTGLRKFDDERSRTDRSDDS
jgi:death-on-curing protein